MNSIQHEEIKRNELSRKKYHYNINSFFLKKNILYYSQGLTLISIGSQSGSSHFRELLLCES